MRNYIANPELTDVLKGLIMANSLPLKDIETDFAADSSGFSISRYVRWFNKKYGREVVKNREKKVMNVSLETQGVKLLPGEPEG